MLKKILKGLAWVLLVVIGVVLISSQGNNKAIAEPDWGIEYPPGDPSNPTYPPIIIKPPQEDKSPTEGDKGIIDSVNNMGDKITSLPRRIVESISDFFLKDIKSWMSGVVRYDIESANRKLVEFQEELTESDLSSSSFGIARTLSSSLKPIALSLLSLFFLISFCKKSMYFEVANEREILKTLLLFVLGKTLIDNSYTICEGILNINNSIVSMIINTVGGTNTSEYIKFIENDTGQTLTTVISNYTRTSGFVLCFLIALVIARVMLILRKIELAVLTSVSPLFISTFAGESTMDVFKSFFKNYISVVAQTIWMGIAFAFLVNAYISGITIESGGILPGWDFLIGGIALAIYCVNAPNSVKSAIGGNGGSGFNLSSLLHLVRR